MNDFNWYDLTDHQKAGALTVIVVMFIGLAFVIPAVVGAVVFIGIIYALAYLVVY